LRKVRKLAIGMLLVAVLVASVLIGGCAGEEVATPPETPYEPVTPENGATEPPTTEIFHFAHLAPLSGPWASWGLSEQIAQEIVIDFLNEAGGFYVDGQHYEMQLDLYDNQGDPSIETSVGRRAIDDGIKYLHTTYEAETQATNDLFTANKIVNIAACAGDDTINSETWPYTFKVWFSNQDGQEVLMEYLLQTYPDDTRLVVIHSDDGGGRTSAREMTDACELTGMDLVDIIYYLPEATEFRAILNEVIDMDVDYIELGTCPPQAYSLIIKQGRELGWDGRFLSTDSIDIGTLEEVVGWDGLQKVYGVPAAEVLATDIGQAWNLEFIERYGSPYASQAIHPDGTVRMLTEALSEAGTFEPDAVVDVLEDLKMNLSYGPTWWRPFAEGQDNRVICTYCPCIEIIGDHMVDVYNGISPRWQDMLPGPGELIDSTFGA